MMRRLRLVLGFLLALCSASAAWTKDFSGLVYPIHDLTLSAGVSGVVLAKPVEAGNAVTANQVLIQLDDRLQSVEVQRRKLIYEDDSEINSVRDRTRILNELYIDSKKVYESTGSVSRDELFRLEAEYLTTKGRLEQLQAQKQRELLEFQGSEKERLLRQVTAPVAGIVTKVEIQIGEWAKQGDPILRMVDPSNCIIRLSIPLHEAHVLTPGMSIPVLVESAPSDLRLTGRVTFVSPVADPASGLVEVKVGFANANLRVKPGAKATISVGGRP